MMNQHTLALIWGGIISFGIILYVVLDGFDLGIGLLMPFFNQREDHDIMVSTILPVWDGNETWLVFGGATLYGAFPLAFSYILPLIYIPIFIMLLGLLFRGVAFEFRLKVPLEDKNRWDYCFFAGSLIATLAQGYILGSFIQGFKEMHSGFNVFCAISLVFGYALLGSNRLILKTEGRLQQKCFKLSSGIQYIILLACILVSVWTPFLNERIASIWFDPHKMVYLAILPVLTILFLALHYYALKKRWEILPFWSSIGIFLMCYTGFIITSYPYVVPGQMTYLEAASPESTLLFMLIGAAVMLPVLLYYTYYAYRIFSGKVTEKLGY
jgi:cytochrome d ubiquinol oxidase subunit II